MTADQMFQYSILSALMDGVAAQGMPIRELLRHGDHGLGTFQNMVGEMIVMDSQVYQMRSDGTVRAVDTTTEAKPFAMVTFFRPTHSLQGTTIADKNDLATQLLALFPCAKNHFVAFRVDGAIKSVLVRTTPGQQYSGQRLAEMASIEQVEHTFTDERGTLVGFRSPEYIHGIGVAGIHLHYISEDTRHGGHVLALETAEVDLTASTISAFHLELPTDDPDFNAAELKLDSDGITEVEG